jgi:glyoxylase-like metal-dependent hydrolase (beta-lactamase superfamily II)
VKRARVAAVVAGALVAAAALFFRTFTPAPLPAPPPLDAPLPSASPPAEMALFQLPTGVTHRSAAFAYRGGAFGDARDFSMTAALVRHPRGDVLIDTGFGRDIDAQIRLMPWPFRAATSYTRFRSAGEQLDATGYDRRSLRAVLLTHAHWDHASGLPEFADTPVLVTPEEHRFVAEGGALTVVARSAGNARYEEYGFEGGPYLGFAKSHDLYGDGAIVVVPAPGHTPGSVIVFVTLPGGKRHAFVGDLAWQREGITEREERPWLQRSLADVDEAQVRDGLLHMAAIAARYPEIAIIPAHDARAFAALPTWPKPVN